MRLWETLLYTTQVLFSTTQIRISHDVLFLVNEMVPRVLNHLLNRHGHEEGANMTLSHAFLEYLWVRLTSARVFPRFPTWKKERIKIFPKAGESFQVCSPRMLGPSHWLRGQCWRSWLTSHARHVSRFHASSDTQSSVCLCPALCLLRQQRQF